MHHGVIEGRALGREKGFELWEELSFYRASAQTWKVVLLRDASTRKTQKLLVHIENLEGLLAQMPTQNDSSVRETDNENAPDLEKLLERIRARFKLTCSMLGWTTRGSTETVMGKKLAQIKGQTVDVDQLKY